MGSLRLDCCVDWLFTPEAEAPPKRRATLIPRAPALGCLHRTRISPRRSSCGSAPWSHIQLIFQCVSWRDTLAASRENRLDAETIASRRSAALHGARQPWSSAALQRPVWTRRDEEDSSSSRADLPREESDIESSNERETECNEEWKPDVVPLTSRTPSLASHSGRFGCVYRKCQYNGCSRISVSADLTTETRVSAGLTAVMGTPAAYRQARLIYVQFLFSFKN